MTGAWDRHHAGTEPYAYGIVDTYDIVARWMAPCAVVEDWGCGPGFLAQRLEAAGWRGRYVGVDGSATPAATITTELATYRSSGTDGIVLRHVLEHNESWPAILANALQTYRHRLAVVLFTPLVARTTILRREPDYDDVPVIAFELDELLVLDERQELVDVTRVEHSVDPEHVLTFERHESR